MGASQRAGLISMSYPYAMRYTPTTVLNRHFCKFSENIVWYGAVAHAPDIHPELLFVEVWRQESNNGSKIEHGALFENV